MRRPVVHVLGDVVNGVHICARCGGEIFSNVAESNRDMIEGWARSQPVGTRALSDGFAVAFGWRIAGARDCRARFRVLSGAKR